MVLRSAALLGILVGLTTPTIATADIGIVVESYTGARPDNAGRLLGPVLEELTTRGFTVGYDGVGRKFEGEVSRPSRTPGGMPGDFVDAIERGHKAWIKGKFEAAVAILSPLIETAHGNAAVVSQDPKARAAIQRGLVDLALAQQRLGDPTAARETMSELIRSFPEAVISRAAHGPEAFDLYEASRKGLAAGGRGTLIVDVADHDSQVFLDEQYAKNGSLRRTDLYPGTYRVYASQGETEGRTYAVVVRAGAEVTLTIDVALDAALYVDPTWTGLAFATAEDRERLEAGYAAKFARLAHAPAVAVVGIDMVRGRLALVGSLVSLDTAREIRRASLAIDPEPSSDRLRALARFLAGDDAARASLDVEDVAAPQPERRGGYTPKPGGSRWGFLKYLTAGVGLAAAGVGTYLVVIDGTCSSDIEPCPQLYNTTVPAWTLVGTGAALLGLGIYMFATDHREPARAITIAPTRGGAIATMRLRF